MFAKSSNFVSLALSFVISAAPAAEAFSPSNTKLRATCHQTSSLELNYRSLHHGPDIEPPTEMEKLGYDFTKMSKDKIDRYGPGDFEQFADFPFDQFDGGDSDMGLAGDGNIGLQKIGRDVSPHLARTLAAKISPEEFDQSGMARMTYADELMQASQGMDHVRAQQLENWATQKEIALANRHMYERTQHMDNMYGISDESVMYEDTTGFSYPVEIGGDFEGTISLVAPVNGVARHDIMLKNLYMGYAQFRAAFVGDACNGWTVTPSDGFLKQNEATHFAVNFRPHGSGVSAGYLVIETEDFKKTWKVVGSTGEYEF